MRKAARHLLSALVLVGVVAGNPGLAAESQDSLVGVWRAITAGSGVQSRIELFLQDGRLFGRMASIKDQNGNDLSPVCTSCKGELAGAKLVGLVFISGLEKSGNKWIGGKVVDIRPGPFQGIVASCELEYVNGKAKIFGYLWIRALGVSNYWDRIAGE